MCVDPRVDLDRVEPNQVAPLHERDASFVDEPTNVANFDAERCRDVGDRDERGLAAGSGRGDKITSTWSEGSWAWA